MVIMAIIKTYNYGCMFLSLTMMSSDIYSMEEETINPCLYINDKPLAQCVKEGQIKFVEGDLQEYEGKKFNNKIEASHVKLYPSVYRLHLPTGNFSGRHKKVHGYEVYCVKSLFQDARVDLNYNPKIIDIDSAYNIQLPVLKEYSGYCPDEIVRLQEEGVLKVDNAPTHFKLSCPMTAEFSYPESFTLEEGLEKGIPSYISCNGPIIINSKVQSIHSILFQTPTSVTLTPDNSFPPIVEGVTITPNKFIYKRLFNGEYVQSQTCVIDGTVDFMDSSLFLVVNNGSVTIDFDPVYVSLLLETYEKELNEK